jgi:hypothetical protein
MTRIQPIEGFRRAPQASSPDATFFITAALAGGAGVLIAALAPYIAAVLLVLAP